MRQLRAIATQMIACVVLSACAFVGPRSIEGGREQYNDIIQATSKEQVFANIVRVHNNEPTLFMDVTEVDANLTWTSQGTFGISDIFGPTKGSTLGTAGALGGAATYSESPTIRYFPLSGQALVQQLTSPITPQSLVYLYGSDWPLVVMFTLSVDRLTLRFEQYGAVLNAIAGLDDLKAIDLLAAISENSAQLAEKSRSAPVADTLILTLSGGYTKPRRSSDVSDDSKESSHALQREKSKWHLWLRLLRIYRNKYATDPAISTSNDQNSVCSAVAKLNIDQRTKAKKSNLPNDIDQLANSLDALDASLDDGLDENASNNSADTAMELLQTKVRCVPRQIFLLSTAAMYLTSPDSFDQPTLRMRSALGAVKQGVQEQEVIRFLEGDGNFALNCYTTDDTGDVKRDFDESEYYLNMEPSTVPAAKVGGCVGSVINEGPFDVNNLTALEKERQLFDARIFVLVHQLKGSPPPDVYVSYASKGTSYYIAADDKISQRNFMLIAQLFTMEAVASPAGSLTPTLSVGGGGGGR